MTAVPYTSMLSAVAAGFDRNMQHMKSSRISMWEEHSLAFISNFLRSAVAQAFPALTALGATRTVQQYWLGVEPTAGVNLTTGST